MEVEKNNICCGPRHKDAKQNTKNGGVEKPKNLVKLKFKIKENKNGQVTSTGPLERWIDPYCTLYKILSNTLYTLHD